MKTALGRFGTRQRSSQTEAAEQPIVIAIDGTSASGKSTNAKLVARALGYVYVDTGAMYRTLAWYCLQQRVDVHNPPAVASLCRRWKTELQCVEGQLRHVRLLVAGYYPETEIRTAETSAAVPHVAAIPKVRQWMKKTQRQCLQFGHLVMEGRDIGTNVFPETDFKFYLDANLEERTRRRQAEGVAGNLAARDERDSQRAAAPLMIPLGAVILNNSHQTPEQTSRHILDIIRQRLKEREDARRAAQQKPRW
ncbi:MAG: (d)CMP kinase [Verrucomicrobia bacterium]|nr:MAG: (d)CMP kinase [Verrucomicrobiota bacterium]